METPPRNCMLHSQRVALNAADCTPVVQNGLAGDGNRRWLCGKETAIHKNANGVMNALMLNHVVLRTTLWVDVLMYKVRARGVRGL